MPSVRASYCKGVVAAMKRDERRDALLAAIEEARPVVREAGMLGWVDARVFLSLADALLDVVGPERARVFWAERLVDAFSRPLMRPLVVGGQRLFGAGPAGIVRMTPQGYALTFRGCGTPRATVEDASARVLISGIPVSMRVDSIVECYRGHCLAALRFTASEGEVSVERERLASHGELTLGMRWAKGA